MQASRHPDKPDIKGRMQTRQTGRKYACREADWPV